MEKEKSYLVILILLLCSCSANYHIKRAIKKDPSLLKPKTIESVITDTIFYAKPILIPGGVDTVVHIDTVFETDRTKVTRQGDNLRIQEKEITIHHYDTIIYKDTVRMEVPVIVYDDRKLTNTQKLGIYLLVLLIITLLIFKWLHSGK